MLVLLFQCDALLYWLPCFSNQQFLFVCVLCWGMRATTTSQWPVRAWETIPRTCSSTFSSTGKTQSCDPLLYRNAPVHTWIDTTSPPSEPPLQTGQTWWMCRLSISTRRNSPSSESRSPFSSKARKLVSGHKTSTSSLTAGGPEGEEMRETPCTSCNPVYDTHAWLLHFLRLFFLFLSFLFLFCPAAIKNFILVPLHTYPNQAVQEIDRLYDVFVEVSKKWDNAVRKWDVTDWRESGRWLLASSQHTPA